LAWLTRLRAWAGLHAQIVPISQLKNWMTEPEAIREIENHHGFSARQFRVVATGREVKSWDQPLIASSGPGRLSLVFQERDGVLQVLAQASYEIGFLEGAQLSTSICIPPGSLVRHDDPIGEALVGVIAEGKRALLLHRCRQSEEGGRFYQEENDYEIVWLDPSVQLPRSDDYRWMTLAQVRDLIRIPGIFSIEFRGVLALLLSYL
jgi:oxidase EvaA